MKTYVDAGTVTAEQTKVPPAPLSGEATPEDIARMVAHLVGRGGVYITGQAINVDGGRCMH
jgi:NAD(P)-dependent dehydrogenase (short-subunit alcohol dehydrogenase family)